MVPSLGGLRLTGDEADHFRKCLDGLIELEGGNPHTRSASYAAVEQAFRRAVLEAIFPARADDESPALCEARIKSDPRPVFEARLELALASLKGFLIAAPNMWSLSIPVSGFSPVVLPLKFGGVSISQTIDPDIRGAMDADTFSRSFDSQVVASLVVSAKDEDAARQLATERLRRTIDILNFYAGFFTEVKREFRAFVAPDGVRRTFSWAIRPAGSEGAYGWGNAYPRDEPISLVMDPASEPGRQIGFSRVDEMLTRDERTDLERRILNALSWAGRAQSEYRREQSFLLLAIALEGLLAKEDARSGNTERLGLRAAHVLGTSRAGRRELVEAVRNLYGVRSVLVHTGDFNGLQDDDLAVIRDLVDRLVTVLLTDSRFNTMKTARDLEKWFDDQLLGPE